MTGPGLAWTMWPSTPKSCSLRLSVAALASSSSRVRLSSEGGGAARSPTAGSWKAWAPPVPKSKVSCQASPFSTRPDLGLGGSFTTRRGGITGSGSWRLSPWLRPTPPPGARAGGGGAPDAGAFCRRQSPASRAPTPREANPSEARVTKRAPTGMVASRMIQVPTPPIERSRASVTAQPRSPPLWIRTSVMVSEARARIPVTLIRSSTSPASPGHPRAMRERMNAPAP